MDFAAQLAKLERQATNAVKKNSNSNTATTTTTSHPNNNNSVDHQFNSNSTVSHSNRNTSTISGDYNNNINNNNDSQYRRHPRDRSPPYHYRNNVEALDTDDRSIPPQRRRYNANHSYSNDRGRSSNNNNSDNRNQQNYHSYSRRLSPQQQQHQSSNNNNNKYPFSELQQSGYRIRPSLPWVPKSDRTKPHICLLAIIIDDLPYEHIWKAWANHHSTSTCSVSLVGHAKYPNRIQSSWLRQRLLVQPPQLGRGGSGSNNHNAATVFADPMYHTHVPEWGSIHIARAMIDCLKDGVLIGTKKASDMKDERYTPNRYVISQHDGNDDDESRCIPTVDKFIFISESCLPVMTLDEYVQTLFPLAETTDDITIAVQDTDTNTNVKNSSVNTNTDHPDDEKDLPDPSFHKDVESNTTQDVESKVPLDVSVNITTDVLPSKTGEEEKEERVALTTIDPWDISWVNGRSRNSVGTPRNMYENNQFQFIDYRIPDECRFKADQWILLSRRHAIHILHIDEHISHPQYQFWTLFQKISASDEMYFPTALGILGLLKDDENDRNNTSTDVTSTNNRTSQERLSSPVLKRSVTYTDWSQGMRNPTSFSNGIRDFETVARLAREQQCLLARKFVVVSPMTPSAINRIEETSIGKPHCTGQITVEEWMDVLHTLSGK